MVAAVVILHNPDMQILDRLLRGVVGQVARVYVIDNTPGSSAATPRHFDDYAGCVSYIPLEENKGIATAQNIGIRRSMAAGCSHVLLLDQDSAAPPDMVTRMLEAENILLSEGKQVAAIGPIFIDEKTGTYPRKIKTLLDISRDHNGNAERSSIATDWIMASGSLIRSSVFSELGLMLDELFIDSVDIEWGFRAKRKGFTCYILPSVLLRHSTGDKVIRILGREIYLHNDVRHRYIVRNSVYLLRKCLLGWKWNLTAIFKIPSYILVYSWTSDHKSRSFLRLCKALTDGMSGTLGGTY